MMRVKSCWSLWTFQIFAFGLAQIAGAVAPQGLESFEGIRPGPGVRAPQGVYLEVTGKLQFPSGVDLTGPFPPLTQRSDQLNVCDFSFSTTGLPAYGLGDYGVVDSLSDIPSGSAFIGFTALDNPPLEFTFGSLMQHVGIYITGSPGLISLTAFDAGNQILGTKTIPAVTKTAWKNNLLTFDGAGIKRIELDSTGTVIVVDSLQFSAVPEPATSSLLLVATSAVFMRRRRMPSAAQALRAWPN